MREIKFRAWDKENEYLIGEMVPKKTKEKLYEMVS